MCPKYNKWNIEKNNEKMDKKKLRNITNKIIIHTFIDIINREQIDLIIEEQKPSHSGLVDDSMFD